MAFIGSVEDRLAIHERYGAYADAVFRADGAAYLACWTEDCARTGTGGECAGLAELREHWDGVWELLDSMTFFTQVAAIDVNGDRADARAYGHEILRFKSGESVQVIGQYDDELRRVGGAWLFAKRHYEVLQNL